MDFFRRLMDQLKQLKHLHTTLTHLPNTIPLGDERYNFVSWVPDPEDIELYGTSEAALNHALEVTFAPQGRKDESAPCPFELVEQGPGLVAVVDALTQAVRENPMSAVLEKWVNDLWWVAVYHYESAGQQVHETDHTILLSCHVDRFAHQIPTGPSNDTITSGSSSECIPNNTPEPSDPDGEMVTINVKDYVDIPEPKPRGPGGCPADP